MAQITFKECNFLLEENTGKFYCDVKTPESPTPLCDEENCLFLKTHNIYKNVELAIRKLETAMLLR